MDIYSKDIKSIETFNLPFDKLSGSNILVTGATGLIGSAIVEILLQQCKNDFVVYASGRNEERAKKLFAKYSDDPYFKFIPFDVTKEIPVNIDFNFVIDAAGGANPKLYQTNPVGVMNANILGVNNLLSYGVNHKLQRFIYVSSGEIYGEGDGREFTEDYSGYVNPIKLRSCYPSAKRASETLCISYSYQYNIEVAIARPSHVYGPGFTESDNRVYAQFIRNILNGEDIILKSKGEAYRSWLYVVDAANAILHLLLNGENRNAYNVADPNSNITIRQLAETVAGFTGHKVVFDIPEDNAHGNTTPITRATFDTSKIQALGWKPLFNIKEGLQHTIFSVDRSK